VSAEALGAHEASSPLPLVINAGAPKAHHRLQSFSRAFCGSQQLQQTHTKAGPPGQSGCCPLPRSRCGPPASKQCASARSVAAMLANTPVALPMRARPAEAHGRVERLETRSRSTAAHRARLRRADTPKHRSSDRSAPPGTKAPCRAHAAPPCLAEGGSQCAADTSPTRGRARRKTGPRPVHMHGPHSNVSV